MIDRSKYNRRELVEESLDLVQWRVFGVFWLGLPDPVNFQLWRRRCLPWLWPAISWPWWACCEGRRTLLETQIARTLGVAAGHLSPVSQLKSEMEFQGIYMTAEYIFIRYAIHQLNSIGPTTTQDQPAKHEIGEVVSFDPIIIGNQKQQCTSVPDLSWPYFH